MTWSFRHKFRLVDSGELPLDEPGLSLRDSGGVRVEIRSVEAGQSLKEANVLAIRGRGFADEETAQLEGRKWRNVVERSFAAAGIGADFGDFHQGGLRFSQAVQDAVLEATGSPLIGDSFRLTSFLTDQFPDRPGSCVCEI